jgi:hypothetical protein
VLAVEQPPDPLIDRRRQQILPKVDRFWVIRERC